MSDPLVSVLMTAYNREKYLKEAIESVLTSTYANFELIIVDDGSKDSTVDIARSYAKKDNRISVYINEKNLGDYPNRNRAASYAKGKYLKYVDSDDMIYPQTLAVMVDSMERYPAAGFGVSSRTEDITHVFSPNDAYRMHFYQRGILDHGPTGSIIVRDKFIACNGFKPLRNVSDIDFWLRMAARYDVVEMPRGLVFWREHEGQEIRIANELYGRHLIPLLKENLFHELCPLSRQERKEVYHRMRKMFLRVEAVRSIKAKNPGYLLAYIRKNYF
jgi:glycosyltransferase involved in cell wall biosynthesis